MSSSSGPPTDEEQQFALQYGIDLSEDYSLHSHPRTSSDGIVADQEQERQYGGHGQALARFGSGGTSFGQAERHQSYDWIPAQRTLPPARPAFPPNPFATGSRRPQPVIQQQAPAQPRRDGMNTFSPFQQAPAFSQSPFQTQSAPLRPLPSHVRLPQPTFGRPLPPQHQQSQPQQQQSYRQPATHAYAAPAGASSSARAALAAPPRASQFKPLRPPAANITMRAQQQSQSSSSNAQYPPIPPASQLQPAEVHRVGPSAAAVASSQHARMAAPTPTRAPGRYPSPDEFDFFGERDEEFESALVNLDAGNGSNSNTRRRSQPQQGGASHHRAQQQQQPGPAPLHQQQQPRQMQPRSNDTKLVPVSSLPDMFRPIFQFPVFNRMQSQCFDAAFNQDVNMVVSAPTSAGKTVLFDLSMLRLLAADPRGTSKIIYIAPSKALCHERAQDWSERFRKVDMQWKVAELTGDAEFQSLKDVKHARIIVCTPEKLDAVTRRWHDNASILETVSLVCIDECHAVGFDSRGATLEVVITRIKTLGVGTRFVAVSATVPNIDDVATWLANGGQGSMETLTFSFGDEYRPCELKRVVKGYPNNSSNDYQFNASLRYKVMEIIEQHGSKKPTMIFCPTRKGCTQLAEQLSKEYQEKISGRKTLPWPKPSRQSLSYSDKKLNELAPYGIAVHHAGMDNSDRGMIERGFGNGSCSIICCTSTLSVGVNLPAHTVIVMGTKMYAGAGFVEYSDLDILQMLGRAGRPQFDTFGTAVIMTEATRVQQYDRLIKCQTVLESGLHKSLIHHINSEITLETITDMESAIRWLRSTFLFVRISKNTRWYSSTLQGASDETPEKRLEAICVEAVEALHKDGIVDKVDDQLNSTDLGACMAKYYVSHASFLKLKALPPKASIRTMLEAVANAEEFENFKFRAGEKTVYQRESKNLRYPVPKASTAGDKVFILIQMILEAVPLAELAKVDNVNPSSEAHQVFQHAPRIACCLVDLALLETDGAKARNGLELLRSLHAKAWDRGPFVLRQLDGIGEKGVKNLDSKGVSSMQDVIAADPRRLEMILGRNAPFGTKLVAQAKSFPRFIVDVEIESEEVVETGVQVDFAVTIRARTDPPPLKGKKGGAKMASILTTTSDQEFVDYRRMKVDTIVKRPPTFDVSVVFVKPSQRLVVGISVDDIAGMEVTAECKPKTSASSFPLPAAGSDDAEPMVEDKPPAREVVAKDKGKKPLRQLSANKQTTIDTFTVVRKPDSKNASKTKAFFDKKPQAASTSLTRPRPDEDTYSEPSDDEPTKRPDGKWECNHICTDKQKCRHLCCREGLDKKPHSRKKSKKRAKVDAEEEEDRFDIATSRPVKATKAVKTKKATLLAPRPLAMPSDSEDDLPSAAALAKAPKRPAHQPSGMVTAKKKKAPSTLKAVEPPEEEEVEEIDELDSDSDLATPSYFHKPVASTSKSRFKPKSAMSASADASTTLSLPSTKSAIDLFSSDSEDVVPAEPAPTTLRVDLGSGEDFGEADEHGGFEVEAVDEMDEEPAAAPVEQSVVAPTRVSAATAVFGDEVDFGDDENMADMWNWLDKHVIIVPTGEGDL